MTFALKSNLNVTFFSCVVRHAYFFATWGVWNARNGMGPNKKKKDKQEDKDKPGHKLLPVPHKQVPHKVVPDKATTHKPVAVFVLTQTRPSQISLIQISADT